MKKGHSGAWLGWTVLLCGAVYGFILFTLKPQMDNVAQLLFGFTLAAFIILAMQLMAASRKGVEMLFDMALTRFTIVYFVIQLCVGGIALMFFDGLPFIPVLIGEVVLLALYVVVFFMFNSAQSGASAQSINDRTAIKQLRMMESSVLTLADRQQDGDLKQALKALAEDIHFSDVSPHPQLAEIEKRISQNIELLEDELDKPGADPLDRIRRIKALLQERNRTAAILNR